MIAASFGQRIAAFFSRSKTLRRTTHYYPRTPISITSSSSTMKFQPTILVALTATAGQTASAWTSSLSQQYRKTSTSTTTIPSWTESNRQQRQSGMAVCSSSSSFLLHSTMAEDVIETPSQQEEASSSEAKFSPGKPIAKGSIINTFRGGLVAVRVDDDLLNDIAPQIVDTTKSLPPTKAASNTLGTAV
jgi:hypothetical protein